MDCGIHDIDMTRWLLNVNSTTAHPGLADLAQSSSPVAQPTKQVKRVIATGSIVAHPELKEQDDCDNALGIVEFANGATCTLHLSRTGMNGYESTVEVYGLEQKLTVEVGQRLTRFSRNASSTRTVRPADARRPPIGAGSRSPTAKAGDSNRRGWHRRRFQLSCPLAIFSAPPR
jgi:myo-inositol 2-dehydrogenase/D-chiro-inositol 1-dehydrogenase